MPVKSGTSHSLAAFLLMIASALIVKYLERNQTFEVFFRKLNIYAGKFSTFLMQTFNLTLNNHIIVLAFITSILGFFWGIVYHKSRYG